MRAYHFGRFRLDAAGRLLYRDAQRVPLAPKAVDLLLMLVERGGAPVSREDLLSEVWSDTAVEEGTLTSHVSLLRKTLGEGFIETIPKRGYRFSGVVHESGSSPARSLLAVLPFEDLGSTRRNDAFSEGLTEELISQLGRATPDRLGVIARTSSMTYRATKKTIDQIGRELGVTHILEGTVRRAGNRVRISAQLIQVSDQTHVWADNYESELEDILALQSSIAREVAKQIHNRLLPDEGAKRVVPEAYEAYLQGRYLWNRRGERDLRAAIRCFHTVIENDATYGPAYAGMADAYLSLVDGGFIRTLEGTGEACALAKKALAIDAHLADAHVSLGHAAMHEFDWPVAATEFRRAVELNPNSSTARFYYSNYLTVMGVFEDALREAEEARRLDPGGPATQNLTSILWLARRYGDAIIWSERALATNPDSPRIYENLGRAYEQMGRFDDSIKAFRKSVALSGRACAGLASLGHAYAMAGRRSDANQVLRKLKTIARRRFVSSWDFAVMYIGLRQYDAAFEWLDNAYEERSAALPFIASNPRLDPIRGDRRFLQLLKKIGLSSRR